MYPVVFLGALTHDAPLVSRKLGPPVAALVTAVCGLKALRQTFSDPPTQYLVLVFAALFFHADYTWASESFLVDFCVMGVVFNKTYELLLKVSVELLNC